MNCSCTPTASGRAPIRDGGANPKLEEVARTIWLEQRGAVAFTCMRIAVMVILLITLFGHLF